MNFVLIFFVFVVVMGVVWVLDKLVFLLWCCKVVDLVIEEFDCQQLCIDKCFVDENVVQMCLKLCDEKLCQLWWFEYIVSFFLVILVVFVVCLFVVELFKILLGLMVLMLFVGDFIFVNKFEYGLCLLVINMKIMQGSLLLCGDVVVFCYLKDELVDYIKCVIGLLGDMVVYQDKQFMINGQLVFEMLLFDFFDDECQNYVKQFEEMIGNKKNVIFNNLVVLLFVMGVYDYLYCDNCMYNSCGVICKVLFGYYFMMGDNCDNSVDSCYWGFVLDQNIVGCVFFIWMNFSDLKCIGFFN